jgi:seryl-tRNA synthetase
LVAVLENYQQEDGSVTVGAMVQVPGCILFSILVQIPDVLLPYMGGLSKITG